MLSKRAVKKILGELPFTAELYWRYVQRGRPLTKSFSLRQLERRLPEWRAQALNAQRRVTNENGKRILIFCTLRYWIEHGTLLGMTLAGLGHKVTLAYLPYPSFRVPFQRFDVRRQNAYAHSVLEMARPALESVSLLDVKPAHGRAITPELFQALQDVAVRDTQYTLQIEAVDKQGHDTPSARLYRLRLERNLQAAAAFLGLLEQLGPQQRPDLLITPNGSILEMGAVYQAARSQNIPAVTYEFGEQRGRIWFDQHNEVMRQDTDALWQAYRDHPLDDEQWEQIKALYSSRRHGRLWENFSRLWQGLPNQGGDEARRTLGLDERPVALLAANVIGDSLTLGRRIFSQDMTEWLQRSVQFFAGRSDVQLVVRIHPGERYLKGPSVAQVVREALPTLPEHIHLVEALDPINTYDLVEIADLGLVYTTTVGMEMAMSGVPTAVGGQTHYRGKGFTSDPDDWQAYFELLSRAIAAPEHYRLPREQIEAAWNYAYRFFFAYPTPFPWHLLDMWGDVDKCPLDLALSEEGLALYGDTFRWLAGEPRRFDRHLRRDTPES
jgi:hypothetical protein